MLETKQLKIFRAVVETGGFTRAGQRLGLSQPAISQQIRALEQALGVALLLRGSGPVRPTPSGEIFLECARHVLDKLDEVTRCLGDHGDGTAGVLRLGAPEPACTYLIPPLLIAAREHMTATEIRVTSCQFEDSIDALNAGTLDIVLQPQPAASPLLRMSEVGRDELMAVVLPSHAWASRRRVVAADFEREPLVLYDRRSPITDRTLRFLLDEGVFPRVTAEIAHLEAVKQMVLSGLGIAVLPWWSVRREVEGGYLVSVQLGRQGLVRAWGLIYPENRMPTVRLRAFVRLCDEVFRPIMTPPAPIELAATRA